MNASSSQWLFKKYHGKRLLVDANILILFLIGSFYRARQDIVPYSAFTNEEFELVAQVIFRFGRIGKLITTPHCLAELTNIAEKLGEHRREFLTFVRHKHRDDFEERFDCKRIGFCRLAQSEAFPRFGLADAAISALAYDSLLVFTNDKKLARYLQDEKKLRNVVYFGDLKAELGITQASSNCG